MADGAGVLFEIAGIEAAPGDEGQLQLVEEVDRDPGRAHFEGTRNSRGLLVNLQQANGMVHPWQCGRESDRADIGLATEPFDQRSLRAGHLLTLRGTNVERDRQDLLGSNSVDGLACFVA